MDCPVKTACDGSGLVIANASHRLTSEVAQALEARRSTHRAMRAIDQEADFPPGLRQESSAPLLRAARMLGGSSRAIEGLEAELRDLAVRRSERIADLLKDRIARRERLLVVTRPRWSDLFVAPPVDHSFWWAETQPHVAPDTRAEFRDDGLHFWGGPKVNTYDGDLHTSFGAVATFVLSPSRFPSSPSGLFLSSPHVELFGGVVAFAPDWDLIQGNGIASCRLFLRQTIFQFRFGPDGPVAVTIAEAKGHDAWRLYLKNTGYSRHQDMPGFKPIPAVTYSQAQVAPNDLLAEVEVRLDIDLNCTGALVWCDPDVLLRHFQWAPSPLP